MLERSAQSGRAASGEAFEKIVVKILNGFLQNDDIVIIRAREASDIIKDRENLFQIMDFTRVPVKRRCDQRQLQDYPDLDLFALVRPKESGKPWRLLAIINCKVSFHARHTEAAFWGLLVRLSSHIPYVLVTEDRDIYKPRGRSEFGRSCQDSRVARRILESFCDRVYLVKKYDGPQDVKLDRDINVKTQNLSTGNTSTVFDDVNIPRHTQYCHSVRPLDDLIADLRHWKKEIPD